MDDTVPARLPGVVSGHAESEKSATVASKSFGLSVTNCRSTSPSAATISASRSTVISPLGSRFERMLSGRSRRESCASLVFSRVPSQQAQDPL
jgi:hypothetical protein